MRAMVIGIRPDYSYAGSTEAWYRNNTYYSANMGACFISRTLLRQFNADYVDDFSDLRSLRDTYDVCLLALSTHIHRRRDVSFYVDLLEQLDMPTFAVSLGIEDYRAESHMDEFVLDSSVKRLLDIVSSGSRWIGVRGPHSAAALIRNGFSNVVPIGCPSLFWNLTGAFRIDKPGDFTKPLCVYHRSLVEVIRAFEGIPLLGQDFQDEAVFTDNLADDAKLHEKNSRFFSAYDQGDVKFTFDMIERQGMFKRTFEEWLAVIQNHDFIVGPRLHGCITSLVHGIPAVLVKRDLRTWEVAEFFRLPSTTYEELGTKSIQQVFRDADFEPFNRIYKLRFRNYVQFLNENGLDHELEPAPEDRETLYTRDDLRTVFGLMSDLYGRSD